MTTGPGAHLPAWAFSFCRQPSAPRSRKVQLRICRVGRQGQVGASPTGNRTVCFQPSRRLAPLPDLPPSLWSARRTDPGKSRPPRLVLAGGARVAGVQGRGLAVSRAC